jgi:hypothetical protein
VDGDATRTALGEVRDALAARRRELVELADALGEVIAGIDQALAGHAAGDPFQRGPLARALNRRFLGERHTRDRYLKEMAEWAKRASVQ